MELVAAERLAWRLMQEHHLVEYKWEFDFHYSYKAFGTCYHSRKMIMLSVHLVLANSKQRVSEVILHEIAHALAGYKAGHGPEWKEMCVIIGALPRACYTSDDTELPETKVVGYCPAGHKFVRQTFPKRGIHHSCLQCGTTGKYDSEHEIKFELNKNYKK